MQERYDFSWQRRKCDLFSFDPGTNINKSTETEPLHKEVMGKVVISYDVLTTKADKRTYVCRQNIHHVVRESPLTNFAKLYIVKCNDRKR
jgi:hypothetical protein